MVSTSPAIPRPGRALTRRDQALLAAVAAGRCHLTPGPLASLLVDRRVACDQLAAQRLLAEGLIKSGSPRKGGLTGVDLTPAGEAALHRATGDH